ncbi:MAG: Rieske 2Fe-2S domain-containing protein [Burkholderiaceae bacterium]|nr:Rieske 2Fe-2S domain-containing protein [Burkholderiaceae bacterium]
MENWIKACAVDDLEDSCLTELRINGNNVLFLRHEGEVHAVPALCPHMDEPLVNGLCDGFNLTCLKHLWQWDIRTGEVKENGELPLKIIPLKIVDGQVYMEQKVIKNP